MSETTDSPGRKLFICGTPLQSLIAERIMDEEGLDKEQCSLFFYSYGDNDKYRYYYDRLATRCGRSCFYVSDFKYPDYILNAKKVLKNFEFDTIYLGSVTSVFCLMALSLRNHKSLITFDDGSANIRPNSDYARKYGFSVKKYLAMKLLGNKYSLRRIRQETQAHYTIYANFKNNISDKLIHISLFEGTAVVPETGRCAVVLGTVFREAFGSEHAEEARVRLLRFMETLRSHVYFIPHPRDRKDCSSNLFTVDTPGIAEEVIGELAKKFRYIDLYGFCSSTQLVMLGNERVSNIFLTLGKPSAVARETIELASGVGSRSMRVLDLQSCG